jgi:hypothetical protein
MADIVNLKKLIGPTAKLATAIGGILADGQVTLGDMRYVPEIFGALRGFAGLEFSAVLPEMKDLTDAEREELARLFKTNFDITAESTEAVIEQGFELVLMALQAVVAFVTIGGKVRKAA